MIPEIIKMKANWIEKTNLLSEGISEKWKRNEWILEMDFSRMIDFDLKSY